MVYVQVDSHERPGWFEELMQQQDEIAIEFGETIRWDNRENLRHKRAIVSNPVDMTDEKNWPSAIEWMLDRMKRIKDVFKPRVMSLSEKPVTTDAIVSDV